jgi:methionine synthase II (cobalamin-independent)
MAEGGYDPVADVLFNRINVHGYFLEYDTPRAGSFAPLRLLPKGKVAVLGLVSSKTPALERADDLKRRIEQAGAVRTDRPAGIEPAMRFRQFGRWQSAQRSRAGSKA